MIGNNPNATPNRAKTSILGAHSEANQNINNLKFVYDENNKESKKIMEDVKDILKAIHSNSKGVRNFIQVNEKKMNKLVLFILMFF